MIDGTLTEDAKVLDHGVCRLVRFSGGDEAVIQSARVSYGRGLTTPEKDRRLVKYMLDHHHGTPFEHTMFTFHVKCPIFVMRQWVRHRMGSFNEISGRYSEMKDEFYVPVEWRVQDQKNKQGSICSANIEHKEMSLIVQESNKMAMLYYHSLLDKGAARELARLVLPVNIYTEFYWTVNARALMNFLNLRCESHAQLETRLYANKITMMFWEKMPWTYEAWWESLDKTRYTDVFDPIGDVTQGATHG